MSLRKSISIATLAALVVACRHAANDAAAVGRCQLQVAYVEGGTTPSVYWMRLCDNSIEFQPLGSKTLIRRLSSERLSGFHNFIVSSGFGTEMSDLEEHYSVHRVPPDRAFYVVQYAGREVHVTPDQLPTSVRQLFAELNSLFEQTYPSYQNYLALR